MAEQHERRIRIALDADNDKQLIERLEAIVRHESIHVRTLYLHQLVLSVLHNDQPVPDPGFGQVVSKPWMLRFSVPATSPQSLCDFYDGVTPAMKSAVLRAFIRAGFEMVRNGESPDLRTLIEPRHEPSPSSSSRFEMHTQNHRARAANEGATVATEAAADVNTGKPPQESPETPDMRRAVEEGFELETDDSSEQHEQTEEHAASNHPFNMGRLLNSLD